MDNFATVGPATLNAIVTRNMIALQTLRGTANVDLNQVVVIETPFLDKITKTESVRAITFAHCARVVYILNSTENLDALGFIGPREGIDPPVKAKRKTKKALEDEASQVYIAGELAKRRPRQKNDIKKAIAIGMRVMNAQAAQG